MELKQEAQHFARNWSKERSILQETEARSVAFCKELKQGAQYFAWNWSKERSILQGTEARSAAFCKELKHPVSEAWNGWRSLQISREIYLWPVRSLQYLHNCWVKLRLTFKFNFIYNFSASFLLLFNIFYVNVVEQTVSKIFFNFNRLNIWFYKFTKYISLSKFSLKFEYVTFIKIDLYKIEIKSYFVYVCFIKKDLIRKT